jgi:hypothetical protein
MEPPDEKIYSFDEESYYNYYNVDFDKNANCGNTTLRIRGAGPNDSDTNEAHKIPYLSSKNFVMDGLPHIDAQQTIIQPLNMGLGTVLQKGWSLLETAQQIDAGGVLHIPNRAAMLIANPDTVKESKSRNQRLFCTIMNYIKNDSYWYLLFMTTFQYDGIAVYNYILLNVTIQTPPKVLQEREHYFKEMTMEKLNMFTNGQSIFRWLFIVMAYAERIGVDATRQKEKFIDGLPDKIFKTEKTAMRQDRRFIYPATYAGLPGFPPRMAATPHPYSGQPNVYDLAVAYYSQWLDAVQGIDSKMIKYVVREVTEIEENDMSTMDTVNMISCNDITWDNTCVVCKGRGHTARCLDATNKIIECPTITLGTKPKDLVEKEKKSNVTDKKNKYKAKAVSQAKQIRKLESQLKAMSAQLESESETPADDGESSIADRDLESIDESSDTDSDSSDGSAIDNFAEQVQGSFKRDNKKKLFGKTRHQK